MNEQPLKQKLEMLSLALSFAVCHMDLASTREAVKNARFDLDAIISQHFAGDPSIYKKETPG